MGKLKTRETVELNTDTTGGAGFQYYDQVCALSQAVINKNFELLFENRPDVAAMKWMSGESVDGELLAELLAPSIEISLENRAECEIFYQLRIKRGHIDYGPNTRQDISGWIISLPAKMQSTLVSVDPGVQKTRAEKDFARAQLNALEENVDMTFEKPTELKPGEYSIHRLFAAIAGRAWGSPVWERSYMINEENEKVPLDIWMAQPGNNEVYARVGGTLSKWARANRTSSLWTLGMQLRLPRGDVKPDLVTFAPKFLQVQTYPYLTDRRQEELINAGSALTGLPGQDYNCFCYCEVADKDRKDLPGTKLLPFWGNLALPAESGRNEVPGTFVLDHRLFLQKHLLPQLQELNVATQIIPLTPFMEVVDHNAVFAVKFCSGSNPEDAKDRVNLPNQVASDKAFQFTLVAPQHYQWSTKRAAPGSTQDFVKRYPPNRQHPLYRRYVTTSETKVDVTWETGKDEFLVKGQCIFEHWESHSFNTPDWPNGGRGRYGTYGGEYWWSFFRDVASWSFKIDLHVPKSSVQDPLISNGIIEPEVVGCHTEKGDAGQDLLLPDNFDVKIETMQYHLGKTHTLVKDGMRHSIGIGLSRAASNIKKNFQGIGKFVYPGSGELKFGPPSITESGNIIADIEYLPPKEGRTSWNPPKPGIIDPAKPNPGKEYKTDPSITPDRPKIAWTVNVTSWDPSAHRIRMILRAKNVSDAEMAFKSVKLMPLRMKYMDDKRLFISGPAAWANDDQIRERLAALQKVKDDRASMRRTETEKRLKDRADQKQIAEAERARQAEAVKKQRATEAQKTLEDIKVKRETAKKQLDDSNTAADATEKENRDAAKKARSEARKKMTKEDAEADVAKENEEDIEYQKGREAILALRKKTADDLRAAEAEEDKQQAEKMKAEAKAQEDQDAQTEQTRKEEEVKRERKDDDAYVARLKAQDEQWDKDDAAELNQYPIPTDVYKLEKDAAIEDELILTPKTTDSEFQFNCTAKILHVEDDIGLPDRFIMPAKSDITFQLNGLVGAKVGTGVFVMQCNEIWASVSMEGTQIYGRADAFVVVEVQDNGNSSVRLVEQSEADRLRGVPSTGTTT